MMRFIAPLILIGISVAVFVMFSKPIYGDISTLRLRASSYNEALGNSKALENARDVLTAKKNSINPENLVKLQKLLPENIDNILLILEIEKIASPYGMVLKDVKYSTTEKDTTKTAATAPAGGAMVSLPGVATAQASRKEYGVWDLSFSTAGSYNNFLNFTRDLESNLRIVDISSIQFSSSSGGGAPSSSSEAAGSYKYDFKIKTYWLKN